MRRAECSSVVTGAPQSQTHKISLRRDAKLYKTAHPAATFVVRSGRSHLPVQLRTSDGWMAGIECWRRTKNDMAILLVNGHRGPTAKTSRSSKGRHMRYVVFGLCVFGAACSGDVGGAPTSPSSAIGGTAVSYAKGGSALPFKGRLEGAATITPGTPPFLSVSIEGTGNATHLGRFSVENTHVVDTTDRTATGTYKFTAANGDTLTADFTGQADPATPGVLSIVETATITGGTGRFAAASGSFTVERLFNQVTGLTSGSFDGTISSPGAGKL
jgi:hypothetical protein